MSRSTLLPLVFVAALLPAAPRGASAQTPDSTKARASVAPGDSAIMRDSARTPRLVRRGSAVRPAAEPVVRNRFGGIERRRPIEARTLLAGNVAAQSVLTVGRGLAEGGRAGQMPAFALGGALAGAGFYGAKRLVGERHTVAGFALAYASWSLAENVAEGEHALSHVRVGFGPLDVRVATPFARGVGPSVRLEAEPVSVAAALVLPLRGFRPRPCAASVCYQGSEPERFERRGRRYRRLGRTVGRVVRVWPPLQRQTEAHEGVHVVQGMQLAAGTPGGTVRELTRSVPESAVALDARVDWFTPLAGGLVFVLSPYESVWTEREAFTSAGPDAAPPDAVPAPAAPRP